MKEKLRAWWSHQQGLDGRLGAAQPAEVFAATGWARSVGGVGPYLTLFARAGTSREAADAAAAKVQIHELPAARNCTYVVPASDFALALKAGESFFYNGDFRQALKLGVTEKEIARLCDAVMKALENGPLEPEAIREAVGKAARSLGEEGKKKGLSTTLPLALGKLQVTGDIRRISTNGRFDQQRYRYALWRPNPLAKFNMSPEQVYSELARRYFSWTGPATLAEFQWFSGLTGKAAKAAAEPLKLAPIGDRLLLPEDRESFDQFQIPGEPHYALVSSIDGIALLRRDLAGIAEAADLRGIAPGADLPNHAIFDRGRLVGLWEYDPAAEAIMWAPFGAADKEMKGAVARTEEFVRAQLGDARSFSLDSPKSRAPRIAALRKVAPLP